MGKIMMQNAVLKGRFFMMKTGVKELGAKLSHLDSQSAVLKLTPTPL